MKSFLSSIHGKYSSTEWPQLGELHIGPEMSEDMKMNGGV
jgi:hypothetical protein